MRWRIDVLTVRKYNDGAVSWKVCANSVFKCISVRIAASRQFSRCWRIFIRRNGRVYTGWRIVDRVDSHRHSPGNGFSSVGHRIGEGVCSIEIRGRRIGERPVRVDHNGPMLRQRGAQAVRQRIAIGITGRWERTCNRRIFVCRCRAIDGDRRVIAACHGNDELCGRGTTVSIAHGVGHRFRYGNTNRQSAGQRIRHKRIGAIGQNSDRSVGQGQRRARCNSACAALNQRHAQIVAIGISVNPANACSRCDHTRDQISGNRCTIGSRNCIVERNRRIIDRCDCQSDDSGIKTTVSVADAIGKAVRSIVVGVGRICECAIHIEHDRAVLRQNCRRQTV